MNFENNDDQDIVGLKMRLSIEEYTKSWDKIAEYIYLRNLKGLQTLTKKCKKNIFLNFL